LKEDIEGFLSHHNDIIILSAIEDAKREVDCLKDEQHPDYNFITHKPLIAFVFLLSLRLKTDTKATL